MKTSGFIHYESINDWKRNANLSFNLLKILDELQVVEVATLPVKKEINTYLRLRAMVELSHAVEFYQGQSSKVNHDMEAILQND